MIVSEKLSVLVARVYFVFYDCLLSRLEQAKM